MHANRGHRIAGAVLMAAVVVAAPVTVHGQDSSPDALAAGSLCAVYQVVASIEQPLTPELLASTRDIVDARLERFGAPDRVVQAVGPDQVLVELAGRTDSDALKRLITAPGAVAFLPVPLELQGLLEAGPIPDAMAQVEPIFSGAEISDATVAEDEQTGELVVDIELRSGGARLFDEFAAEHFGEQFAIVLDEVVQVAPSIMATSFGGRAQISRGLGGFGTEEAAGLAAVLGSGPLPAPMEELTFGPCDGIAVP